MKDGKVSKLDERPARPLTDREIVKILCGTIGGLLEFCDFDEVRNAVRWLDEKEEVWSLLRAKTGRGES